MASVNKVQILGRVGRDPEVRRLASGMAAVSLSIATSAKRKDKISGQYIEDTQWHRVQFFDKLAEIVGEYVGKGKLIYVEGRLKYGKYTDKNGVEQNTCDIVATEMQMLGGNDSAPKPAPVKSKPQAAGSGCDDFEDSIPF